MAEQASSLLTATSNKKISGLSAGIGALTFGKGLVGGLFKHNQAQHNFRKAKGRARKAADRANRRIAENYKLTIGNDLADIQSTEQQWSAMIDQSMADAAFLDDYAGDVYVQRQQKLNEVFAAEAFRQQGTAIIFPSFLAHKVNKVKSGTRYAVVGWVHGPTFK